MSEIAVDSPRPLKPLWRNANFTLMWTSIAASGFGDRLIMLIGMALMGTKDALDGKTRIPAAIDFWFFLPYLFISPFAGWLADRLPRKWLMMGCDEIRAALLFFAFMLVPIAGAAAIPDDHHWKVFALVAAVGTFAAIFSPARSATVPQVIPMEQLQAANGILISIATIASLIGMLVGGAVIDEKDSGTLRTVLLMAIAIYVVSGGVLTFLKIRHRPKSGREENTGLLSMFAALGYMKKHRRTIGLTATNMLVWGAAMIVSKAFVALCSQRYGFSDDQILGCYSQMMTALGGGMLAGGVTIALINTQRESVPLGLFGLVAAGLCVAVMAISRTYFLGLVMAFGIGFFGNVAIICTFSLLMAISPNYIRGRVMGINSLATTLAIVLANFIIWQLPAATADRVMLQSLLPTAAVLMIVGGWGLRRLLLRGPMPRPCQNFFWHTDRMFMLIWHRAQWFGRDRVPSAGPVLVASNHTAGIDPFLIQAAVQRPIRWVMVRKNFYRALNPLWRAITPIVLDPGKHPIKQLKTVLEALSAGQIVGIFPEGGLQRDHRMLQPMQGGVGMMAVRSGAKILPVWVTGTPMHRKMWAHFLKPSRSRVYFGQPYTPDASKSYEEIVEDLRRRMVALAIEAEGKPPQETDIRHG